jgi:hypothetical protein
VVVATASEEHVGPSARLADDTGNSRNPVRQGAFALGQLTPSPSRLPGLVDHAAVTSPLPAALLFCL